MAFFFSRLIRYAILFYAIFAGAQYLLRVKTYNFSPKEFRTIAEKNAKTGASAVTSFASDLRMKFGPLVASELAWTALQAGGLQLKSMVIHASLTEFIVAFHAPFATTGRSGFHFANTTCTVLSGQVQRVTDMTHSDTAETFAPGTNFRHSQFESSQYFVKEKSYVVCYGRGLVPASSLWALPGNLLNGDLYAFVRHLYLYGRATYESTAYFLVSSFDQVKRDYFHKEL